MSTRRLLVLVPFALLCALIAAPLAVPRLAGAQSDPNDAVAPRRVVLEMGAPGEMPDAAVLAQLAALAAPDQAANKMPRTGCTVAISETVNGRVEGAPMPVCEEAEIQVTMGVTCPTSLPMHLVFVIGKHLLMEDHLDEVKRQARAVLEAIDFTPNTKVGVVSVSLQQRVEQELTDSKGRALSAIQGVRLDNVNPLTRYTDWIGKAQEMLEKARTEYAPVSPIEVILIYSTGCPQVSGGEQYCNRQIASAGKAKGLGMTVVGVCKPDVMPFGLPIGAVMGEHCRYIRQMATNGYYYDLRQAPRSATDVTALGRESLDLNLDLVRLTEVLGPGVQIVPGSLRAESPVTPTVNGNEIAWSWPDITAGTRLTATYRISPTTAVTVPLRTKDSHILLVDTLERLSDPLPVPMRDLGFEPCIGPTATPTPLPPTATPTPRPTDTPTATPLATATATTTPTPEPGMVYLPVSLQGVCLPGKQRFDVVLAIDASSSMTADSGGMTGIAAARDAAGAFLDLLALEEGDRAAILTFHATAQVVADLGANRAELDAAVAGIVTGEGTRIDRAMQAASDTLAARSGSANEAVLVLLTDGQQAGPDALVATQIALRVRTEGVRLFTVGLGAGVEEAFLIGLAGDPLRFLRAPSVDDLRTSFERIARDLPCPGGTVWPLADQR